MYSSWNRVALCLFLASCCGAGAFAQQLEKSSPSSEAAVSGTVAGQGAVMAKKSAAPRGRLPRYFGSLVDDVQRQEIYQIQAAYRERIKELQAELAKLQLEQMTKMEQTLTVTQLEKLSELREQRGRRGPSSVGTSSASASEADSTNSVAKASSSTESQETTSSK